MWFLDHNYLENMFAMFRKVAAKERVVGFYSSHPSIKVRRQSSGAKCSETHATLTSRSPSLQPNDLKINALLSRFCTNPVFVTVDVRPNQTELPTTAYLAVDGLDGGEIKKR